jgi:[protein-PII] uridylyltransferase
MNTQPARQRHQANREKLITAFWQNGLPDPLVRGMARSTDELLCGLWSAVGLEDHCLVAVGGYGRGELFPFSDVDLLILMPAGISEESNQRKIEDFVTACWDNGLEIGHSVRTIAECLSEASKDVTVQTAMLEMRFICGERQLALSLHTAFTSALKPAEFFSAKLLELRQRHHRFEDTPFSLEPNCKESPGGLRDLHVILWVARAAHLGTDWRELADSGLITPSEAKSLARNERLLKRIRIYLHLLAKRREDRLVFDLQSRLAGAFRLPAENDRQASELVMQSYYWAAKAVTQLSTLLMQNIQALLISDPLSEAVAEPIDDQFVNRLDLLDIANTEVFERDPSAILRAFLVMQQHPELKGMTARAMRAILFARRHMNAGFRSQAQNKALFLTILQQPQGITHAMRRMNQLSVLGRYLPAFRRIVGRMQHDLFHVYTVDQHILTVLRNVRRFDIPEHAHEYPFCSELIAAFDKPWLLYVVALFHDIAKGRGGDHSKLGMVDAAAFCRAHDMSEEDTRLVVWCVEHHLTMSTYAQKRDLSDPDVIREFSLVVGSERHLVALYLFTVADIRGTSPKVWNAWKGKLLEDLFRMTRRLLAGEAVTAASQFDRQRVEAIKLLRLYGLEPSVYAEFWEQLDVGYFLRNDASDIAWQTRMFYRHVNASEPVVRTRLAPIGEGFQITVYVKDQRDLFARVCGYFDSKNLSVLDARVYTSKHGYALDTFLVVDPSIQDDYRSYLSLFETELTARLSQQVPLGAPVRGRQSRRSKSFPVPLAIELRPDEGAKRYLLSISANDKTGLLYQVACVLAKHGLTLHNARISTLGERVEDTFLIDGPALNNPREQLQIETELLEAVR